MKAFACAAVLLLGCSKDSSTKKPADGSASGSTQAKTKRAISIAAVDAAATQTESDTVLVVVKADGTASVVSRVGEGELDLATVVPGDAVPVAELAGKVVAAQDVAKQARAEEPPPPHEPVEEEEAPPPEEEDDEPMALDEGKMGKKDSDRAEGQYKMKNNNTDPQLARQQALDAARRSGILGQLSPCSPFPDTAGYDDADIYGGLVGTEPGETNGGFGYGKSGFGAGGGGTGWGTIGTSSGYGARMATPAGLRGLRTQDGSVCGEETALVVIDPHAPASKLIEVLTALPRAQVAVTTDGGAHARALSIHFTYTAGNQAPPEEALEIGFLVGPDGAKGAGYRGTRADDTLWSWTGQIGQLDVAYHEGQAKQDLLGATFVRIRIEDRLNAGALIEAMAKLVAGNVDGIALGEATVFAPPTPRGDLYGHPSKVPQVRIGQPDVTGDLDKAVIRRYIKRNLSKITYCYEKELLANAKLEGTVSTQFVIGPNGVVTSATAKGVDPAVSECVAGVLKSIEFPKPKGGGAVNVTYPFTFRKTGD